MLWAASRLLASDPAIQVQCLGVDRFSTLAIMAVAAFGAALIVEVARGSARLSCRSRDLRFGVVGFRKSDRNPSGSSAVNDVQSLAVN